MNDKNCKIGFSDIGGIFIGKDIKSEFHRHYAITILISFGEAFKIITTDKKQDFYKVAFSNAKVDTVLKGVKLGAIIGILWVFPHGLAMAATHETSLVYEFKNTLYHVIEQGIGGFIIFYVFNYFMRKKELNQLKTK